jgi:glycerophosphoryl diester phosphodiesterase
MLVAHRTPPTRTACEQLAADGATVFEVDIQLDAAGAVVVSHYVPFGAGGRLQRDNWRLRWHTAGARDLRLDAVAAIVPERCQVLLDLKERIPERRARLVTALSESLPDRSRYIVCGHPAADVAAMRAAGFRTWRSVGNPRHLAAVLAQRALPDDAVTIRHTLLRGGLIDRLHDRVPSVVAWTVNSVGEARRVHTLGVEGVTTDRPAVLRELARMSN